MASSVCYFLVVSGQDAKLSGFIRYEYINEEAPKAFEISIAPLKTERTNEFELEYNESGNDEK
ncbi:hypothetical protein ACSAZK_15910 [Methanosarcina sp. Mfa9]|uniref:hypothetical protein n=1 Tax=Methanosarcina sp. Mfa9 TaxID=3439063 RepID=UPI003F834775